MRSASKSWCRRCLARVGDGFPAAGKPSCVKCLGLPHAQAGLSTAQAMGEESRQTHVAQVAVVKSLSSVIAKVKASPQHPTQEPTPQEPGLAHPGH